MSSIDRGALAALREKYVEMRRMRELHDAGSTDDPRPAMRALAARFPGALREIDELEMTTIDARIEALDGAIERDAPELWMIALARYHAWLRRALRLRREVPDRTLARARVSMATPRAPEEEELGAIDLIDDHVLDSLLRPPGGRLNRVILERVASELGVSAPWIESLLRGHESLLRGQDLARNRS